MAISRWDPYKGLSLVQERLNQLFKEALYSSPMDSAPQECTFIPAVDILETRGEVILKAELPGVLKEDIEIKIEEDVLILKGARRFEKEVDQENYYRMECSYGSFQRAFTLPKSIKKNEIQAQFKEGVLEIRLPKAGITKPTRIKVE